MFEYKFVPAGPFMSFRMVAQSFSSDPFQDSIDKWKAIAEFLESIEPPRSVSRRKFYLVLDGGTDTCGLCHIHYDEHERGERGVCGTCPIYDDTERGFCKGTPYREYCGQPRSKRLAAAKRMVKYLEYIKEKYA